MYVRELINHICTYFTNPIFVSVHRLPVQESLKRANFSFAKSKTKEWWGGEEKLKQRQNLRLENDIKGQSVHQKWAVHKSVCGHPRPPDPLHILSGQQIKSHRPSDSGYSLIRFYLLEHGETMTILGKSFYKYCQ